MLNLLAEALIDISNFGFLLFVFIFTYSILGMEWFSNKAKFNYEWHIDFEEGEFIESNFNTFIEAFSTVFIVLTGETWCETYYKHYRGVSGPLSFIFFISLKLIGTYIVLLLFLAILIEYFDEDSINQEFIEEKRIYNNSIILNKIKSTFWNMFKMRSRIYDIK
jgi:hypothetical protein